MERIDIRSDRIEERLPEVYELLTRKSDGFAR
jgi:hypothetical protein